MKKTILIFSILFLMIPSVFAADLAYETSDSASLIAGGPARAARVKNMFDTVKNYINAVSGSWVTNSRIIDDTITGAKLADAVAGNGLEKDGSENLQIKSYSVGALGITSGALSVKVDDIYIEISGVSNELTIKSGSIVQALMANDSIGTDNIIDANITEAKIVDGAVSVDKLASDSVTTVKILDGAITSDKLESALQQGVNPAGTILPYGGISAPTGYLLCDGSSISRTTYLDLYNVIGTYYGSGDGATTFNLPDTRNRFAVGAGSTYALGATGGAESVTLTSAQSGVPAHTHTSNTDANSLVKYITSAGSASIPEPTFTSRQVTYSSTAFTVNANAAANAAESHENLPPYLGLNYIIKY